MATECALLRSPTTAIQLLLQANWLGKATFDKQRGRFLAFEMIALGGRTGYTTNNGRGPRAKPSGKS